jgi:hypothetical protein
MMKTTTMVLACCLTVLPSALMAQVEVGIEGGLQLHTQADADNLTQFDLPVSWVRLGFPREHTSFEMLAALRVHHASGQTVTLLESTPGLNFPVGDGTSYVRGEMVLSAVFSDGDNATEWGAGIAYGVRKPIDEGPISFRFEVGYDRFFDSDVNRFRALVGLSATLGS